MNKGFLVLENGSVFEGMKFGVNQDARGEIVFNTSMTGYQEIFTDPSYYGQLMVTTNAHIGNYGVHKEEVESDSIKISGSILKDSISKSLVLVSGLRFSIRFATSAS